MDHFRAWYRRALGVREIEESALLQLLFYVITLSFFVTFYGWVEKSYVSITTYVQGTHVCPPYFPSCGDFYFLEALPYGYSQSAFYVFLFLVLGYGVFSAYRKDWVSAHQALLVAFTWKVIWGFLLTYGVTGNFDYYDLVLACVWLFLREKEYFSKLSFVFLYVLASTIKIDEGWIFANYFNSLFTGAPVFGSGPWLLLFTNLLIVMQMLGSWLLLSRNTLVQQGALVYFMLFHIYSGILVNYRYITVSIPALFVLFFQPKPFAVLGVRRSTIAGYLFLLCMLMGQMVGVLIPGNQKETLEGNYYGLYMFEANHQCISTATIFRTGGDEPVVQVRESHVANNRCDPYRYWFPLQTRCERDSAVERIAWTFDHSINGAPYRRIVDVPDACTLTYSPLAHNAWIRLDDDAPTQDIPVYKNGYAVALDERIKIEPEIIVNDALLARLTSLYWVLWVLSVLGLVGAVGYASVWRKNNA